MKQLLLSGAALALMAGAASAADLPRRAAPPVLVAAPEFTWTGVYIGTHTAYTFTDRSRVTTTGNDILSQGAIAGGFVPGAVSARSSDGFANLGGGFGINYQLTPGSGFVIGAAFDADWTDLTRNTFVSGAALPFIGSLGNVYTHQLDFLATANGRLGYAFDHVLVYGTAGAAIGRVRYGQGVFLGTTLLLGGGGGGNEVGFNYGGGIEYAIPKESFLSNLSVLKLLGINLGGTTTLKAEYIHYDLGSQNVFVGDTGLLSGLTSGVSRFKSEGNMVRAGFSYKFP